MSAHHTRVPTYSDARSAFTLAGTMHDGAGLTQDELEAISGSLGPGWCVVPHQDLDGTFMAVVMADGGGEAPTWVVHKEGALLRLDACRDDAYTRIGAYAALPPLLASLRAALGAAGGR